MEASMHSSFDIGSVPDDMEYNTVEMSREERAQRFGLDCISALVWQGASWQPGGEFVKKLVIRNTTNRMLHVRYALPATKFFVMGFPDPVELSPGLSVTLEVRFRPIRFDEYSDSIQFATELGTFRLPIRAFLARLNVSVSPEFNFGVVPVNEPSTGTIVIENSGEVEATFDWTVATPFLVTPRHGKVQPKSTFPINVTVLPKSASILEATAHCSIQGGELRLPVSLLAHGKYQHLQVEPQVVDWGGVPVGAKQPEYTERVVHVRNSSSVRATVDIEPLDSDRPALIQAHPSSLALHAGQTGAVRLRFKPHTAGMFTCERFKITSPGGVAHIVTCHARCVGSIVSIARKDPPGQEGGAAHTSTSLAVLPHSTTSTVAGAGGQGQRRPHSLYFGDCKLGESVTHMVSITNHSREPAAFDLECEDSGVFLWSDTKGVIPGGGVRNLVVRFQPRVAGNYYRRVQCLVTHSDPAYLDCMGTGWDDKCRPASLKQKHVDSARLRPAPLRFLAPDALLQAVQGGQGVTGATASAEAEWQLSSVYSRSGDRSRAANALYAEYFLSPTRSDAPVALTEEVVEFKPTRRSALTLESRSVTVLNRTHAKMSVQWLVPASKTAAGRAKGDGTSDDRGMVNMLAGPQTDFRVVPDRCDVDPGSSSTFRVTFTPSADSYYYFQELECWVAPKVNRSFRLVDEASFTPPVSLALKVLGHTFSGAEAFSPLLSTSFGGSVPDQTLQLPPCALGESVYYTFQLTNAGEVPTLFELGSDPTGIFALQPSVGMLPVKSFQCVTVRFTPRHARHYSTPITLTLNHSPAHSIRIHFKGEGDTPRLLLPDAGLAYIKPTSLGLVSHRTITLRNTSRVPLRFELRLPAKHAKELALSHVRGDIPGNGSMDMTVSFAPRRMGLHRLHIPVLVYPLTASETNSLVLLDALAGGGDVSLLEEDMHKAIPAGGEHSARGDSRGSARAGPRPTSRGETPREEGSRGQPPRATSASSSYSTTVAAVHKGAGAGAMAHIPGEPLQRLALTVVSEGTFGALSFDTRHLDFGAAIVQGRVSAPLYIENHSDCTLRYSLDAVVQVQLSSVDMDRDGDGVVEMEEIEEEFEEARWYAARRKMSGGELVQLGAHELGGAAEEGGVVEGGAGAAGALEGGGAMAGGPTPMPSLQLEGSGSTVLGNGEGGAPAYARRLGDTEPVGRRLALAGEASLHGNLPGVLPSSHAAGRKSIFTRTVCLSLKDPRAAYKGTNPGLAGTLRPVLSFDQPEGVIAAHSRMRVEVAFSPAISATFRFRIFYNIHAEDGRPLAPDPTAAISEQLQSTFSASRRAALSAAADAEADPRDPAMVDWSAEPRNSNELLCDAVGVGAYPYVCVEDARLLCSRESLLTLFPAQFAGSHNGFAPEKVRDKAELLDILGLSEDGSGPQGGGGEQHAAGGALAAIRGGRGGSTSPPLTDPFATQALGLAGQVQAGQGGGGGGYGMTGAILTPFLKPAVPPAPRPSPHDLWVRPGAWRREGVAWGSAQPEEAGWGGWRVALAPDVHAAGSTAAAQIMGHPEQLPCPRVAAPDVLMPLGLESAAHVALPGLDEVGSGEDARRDAVLLQGLQEQGGPLPTTAAVWRLWSQCSLRDLNRYLSTRLTGVENRYNQATQMTRDPTTLAAFPLEFTPAPLGSPPAVLLLHFRNSGKLPASLTFAMPNEKDLDTEAWADVNEPSADELQDTELLERRIFGVSPRRLDLLPGQGATVRFHYAYASMLNAGAHEIVVMMRVRNGKPVRLFLRGRTLSATTPYLYCAVPSRILRLAPVPIGLKSGESPVQTIPLYNPSSVPLRWRVSPSSVEALARENYGLEIVRLLNMGGVIAPGGEGALQLVFTPLEQRIYRLRLDIAFVTLQAPGAAGSGRGVAGSHALGGYKGGKGSSRQLLNITGAEEQEEGTEAEVAQLKKLLKIARKMVFGARAPRASEGGAPWEEQAHSSSPQGSPGGAAALQDMMGGAHTGVDAPDVGVGMKSGESGFERDYPGILQLKLVMPAYTSPNAKQQEADGSPVHSEAHLPLVPCPPTMGLGLAPPRPPKEGGNVPTVLKLDSTMSSEVLPSASSPVVKALDVHEGERRGARGAGQGAGRRNSIAYAPPPSEEEAKAGIWGRAVWGSTGGHDSLADGVYGLSGMDTLSAAVSTAHNPIELVCSLQGASGAVYSGPQAAAAVGAAAQLAHAQAVLARLAEVEEGEGAGAAGDNSSLIFASPSIGQMSQAPTEGLGEDGEAAAHTLAQQDVLQGGQLRAGSVHPTYTLTKQAQNEAARGKGVGPGRGGDGLYSLMSQMGASAALRTFYRPGTLPPLFVGAYPPCRPYTHMPHADLPEGLAAFSSSWLRFGDVPTRAVQHSLVILRHVRHPGGAEPGVMSSGADAKVPPRPLQFAFDARHPLVASGILKIHPMKGLVAPGEAVLVRVTLHAPLQAAILAADVSCVVAVTPGEQRARATALLHKSMQLRDMLLRKQAGAVGVGSASGGGKSHGGGGGRLVAGPDALSGHVSVADKTTASRAHKLEATARELAWRASVRLATEEERRKKSVYTARAGSSSSSGGGGGRGGWPSASGEEDGVVIPGFLPTTPQGTRGKGRGAGAAHRPPAGARQGNAVHLLAAAEAEAAAAAAARAGQGSDLESKVMDGGASIAPAVGDEGVRMGQDVAKHMRSLVSAQRGERGDGGGGMGEEVLYAEGGEGGEGQGGMGSLPPAYTRESSSPERKLMSSVVKQGLGLQASATGLERSPDMDLLRAVVAGAHVAGGGVGGPGSGYQDHKVNLEQDIEETRRIRIASRSRARLSPPRTAQQVTTAPAQPPVGQGGQGGQGGRQGAVVDASRLLLPPPPHALLHLHVTARICTPVEFTQAYSAAHMAAFFHPGAGGSSSSGRVTHLPSPAPSPSRPAAAGEAGVQGADADVVRGVLHILLADALHDPRLASTLTRGAAAAAVVGGGGMGGGDPATGTGRGAVEGDRTVGSMATVASIAPASRTAVVVPVLPVDSVSPGGAGGEASSPASPASPQQGGGGEASGSSSAPMALPTSITFTSLQAVEAARGLLEGEGITFAQLKAAGGDISRVPSRAQRRAASRGGPAPAAPGAPPKGRPLFDCSIPPARGGPSHDIDCTSEGESGAVMHEGEAREAVERVLESCLLALAKECMEGGWDPLAEPRRELPAYPVPQPAPLPPALPGDHRQVHTQSQSHPHHPSFTGGQQGQEEEEDAALMEELQLDEQERAMFEALRLKGAS